MQFAKAPTTSWSKHHGSRDYHYWKFLLVYLEDTSNQLMGLCQEIDGNFARKLKWLVILTTTRYSSYYPNMYMPGEIIHAFVTQEMWQLENNSVHENVTAMHSNNDRYMCVNMILISNWVINYNTFTTKMLQEETSSRYLLCTQSRYKTSE